MHAQADTDTNGGAKSNIAPQHDQQDVYIYPSKTSAFVQLFNYYNVDLDEETYPCWQTESHQLTCSSVAVETWQEFEKINRPAVFSLITEDKNIAYAIVAGVNESSVLLIDTTGHIHEISKVDIGRLWNGNLVYLWRQPPEFSAPLSEGMRSSTVTWVAEQFAILDKQKSPITENGNFSAALKTRAQIFQSNNGLESDGVIGERTLMKLNEKLGLSPVLLKDLPHPTRERSQPLSEQPESSEEF
jgi:general secretion pathway protein A